MVNHDHIVHAKHKTKLVTKLVTKLANYFFADKHVPVTVTH